MILAAKTLGSGTEKGSLLWLVVTIWIVTMGELYFSPIGLSFVTKVAPPRMLSMMMGMSFLGVFLGNYLSGYIGTFYEKMPKESFFMILCTMGILVGLLFYAAESRLKKLVGDV